MLSIEHLAVRYNTTPVLHDLSFSVQAGEIVGLLGPNGAGKSTLLRAVVGLIRPEPHPNYSHQLLGVDLRHQDALPIRSRIGFVPDPDGLDPRLRAIQNLDDLAALSGVAPVDRATACDALELRPADLQRRIGQLSRGTRQKVALVQGLQHRPDLIVLDEPSEGLDPFARQGLMTLLQAARARGAGVVFSSHVLSDVELICDRVAMIRAGQLLTVATLQELRQKLARRVSITVRDAALDVPIQAQQVEHHGDQWHFVWHGDLAPLLTWLAAQSLHDVTITPPTLADVFAALYGAHS